MSSSTRKKKANEGVEIEVKIDHSPKKKEPIPKPVIDDAGIKDGGLKPFKEELVKDVDEANKIEGEEYEIKKAPSKRIIPVKNSVTKPPEDEPATRSEDFEKTREFSKFHPKRSAIGTAVSTTNIQNTQTIYADKRAKKYKSKSDGSDSNSNGYLAIVVPLTLLWLLFWYVFTRHPEVFDSFLSRFNI